MISGFIYKKTDFPLESAILTIAGLTMITAGVLLIFALSGFLPYYENGFYGLLLVMFSLQTVTMGKTPFGEARRSWPVFSAGALIAAAGIVISVIPGIPVSIPRIIVFTCLVPGTLFLILQMLFSKDKYSVWIKHGGVLLELIPGCGLVYFFSILTGILIVFQGLSPAVSSTVLMLLYGSAILYLAFVLYKVHIIYPQLEESFRGDVGLTIDQTMMALMGIFMILLGILLIPVNLGIIPFSGSAQLGLLMIFFAVQMLASGNTPVGSFPRSFLIIASGILFAVLGIISCIIPQVLVLYLTILIGILNILGAVLSLWKTRPRKEQGQSYNNVHPVVKKIFITQTALNLLAIIFGVSMLISGLIPGLVIGLVLAANGAVLLYLLYVLIMAGRMNNEHCGTV